MEHNIGLKIPLIYVSGVYFYFYTCLCYMMYSIEFLGVVNIYRLYVGKGFEEAGWSKITHHNYLKYLNMICMAVNFIS